MVNDVSREGGEVDMRTDPEKLLDRNWIGLMLLEHCEELVDLIRPILKKSLGLNPVTEEEQAIANFFGEHALEILAPDDDEFDGTLPCE